MNSVEFNLYPNLKKTITMTKIRYNIFEYKPFSHAKISIQFLDENDIPVDNKLLELNVNNGFLNWNADDRYLQTWITANL